MNKLAFAAALVLLLVLTGHAQDSCQRHLESAGGFSICAPVGWETMEKEGQKFKILFGTKGQYFTPNINFKDDTDPRLVNDYATAGVDYILKHYADVGATSVKLVTQEPFTTASGAAGVRVALRAEFKGLVIRTLQYYFNGKGEDQKVLVTGTALEADQATLDPIFDRAAKSFRLEK